MGHGHSHRAGHDDGVEVAAVPRTALLSVLAAALVLTVVGLLSLWPDGDEVDELRGSVSFAAEGVTLRSLTSSIGLVLAVPLTTLIAALTVPGPSEDPSTTV